MRDTFAVKIELTDYPIVAGEVDIHITRNGYQWQVVTLEADEAVKVAETILAHSRSAAEQEGK